MVSSGPEHKNLLGWKENTGFFRPQLMSRCLLADFGILLFFRKALMVQGLAQAPTTSHTPTRTIQPKTVASMSR